MTDRKPLTFVEDDRPPAPSVKSVHIEKQQIGARIPAATYRRLKVHAAEHGVTIAVLVEQAILEFLENHPNT